MSVQVSVEAAGYLAALFPQATFVVVAPAGTTVDGLLRDLTAGNPGFAAVAYHDGKFSGGFQVVVGDQLLELAGWWERVLADGDLVVLLPPFAGG